MKFIVRDGFVVHIARIVENAGQKAVQEASHFAGQAVEFVSAAEAALHLHKLEPKDKEAQTLHDAQVSVAAPVQATPIDQVALATAVAAVLAGMGIRPATVAAS